MWFEIHKYADVFSLECILSLKTFLQSSDLLQVYTWGKGYCGALGHGDENEKTSPGLLTSLKGHLAVQV